MLAARRLFIVLVSLVFAISSAAGAQAAVYSEIYVYGDSLSDTGNVYGLSSLGLFLGLPRIPPSPYYQGRFSNGPTWVEHVGAGLGLDASTAAINGGNNWAFGGAQVGFENTAIENVIGSLGRTGIRQQIVWSVEQRGAGPASRLNVVWGGANDFFSGQTNPLTPAYDLTVNLYGLYLHGGAREFLVPNLPPLGETPAYNADPLARQTLNARAQQFNEYLALGLDYLEANLPDIRIHRLDVHGLFEEMLASPSLFGFDNITQSAFDGGTVAPNADRYLFWDSVHPTATAHRLLGERAIDLLATSVAQGAEATPMFAMSFAAGSPIEDPLRVPEPAAGTLAAALALLTIARRSPRHAQAA